MIIVIVSLDPATVGKMDIGSLLQEGQLYCAEGWLNTRWGDFSALELARDAGLEDVEWESLTDDTAGTLKLTIVYPLLTKKQIEERLGEVDGVDAYELETPNYDIREIVERHSATMD